MWLLRLQERHIQAMIDHAVAEAPHEICGILAGNANTVSRVIPIANVSQEPMTRYDLSPIETAQALAEIEREGLSWMGVYHSHPQGAPRPSQTDIREATAHTPTLVHVIVSLKRPTAQLQAWHIHDGQVDPVEMIVGKQQVDTPAPLSRSQGWAVIVATIIGVLTVLAVSFALLPPAPPLPLP
ncbi:MAG: M67 family metallopeptidase [Chloroflexota bacterium]